MTTQTPEARRMPLVSVCIITYRHARYIRQCVESALAQKTDFPFEIVIGEDESDDGTREICQQLAAAHPDRIQLVLNRRADVVHVDGRPRGTHNLMAALAATRGEFIALCEGDDYWTDTQKLALQISYLRANTDCTGCFHEASLVDQDGRETQPEFFKPQVATTRNKYDRRACIGDLLSKYATCSLMFRRDAFPEPPAWYLRRSSDFFFDLVLTRHGSLGFIDRRMAAYRRHSGGVWSGQPRVMQMLELITRFRLLLGEPEFYPAYRDELMGQLIAFERAMALQYDVLAAQRELAAEKHRSELLLADRDKLVKFMEKQHAIIQSYNERPGARPLQQRSA